MGLLPSPRVATRGRGDISKKAKKVNGYLDRLRENLEALDEAITTARAMSKAKEGADSHVTLQWTKTLASLVELRNATLVAVKLHLLGRDNTFGLPVEPEDHYDSEPLIMFERDVQKFLSPWTQPDLELKCEDCGVDSEEVRRRELAHPFPQRSEYCQLCPQCYQKRQTKEGEAAH